MLNVIAILIALSIWAGFLTLIVFWLTHLSMNWDEDKPSGWGTTKKFKEQFEKAPVIWEPDPQFSGSLFAEPNEKNEMSTEYWQIRRNYKIHASLFCFDGKLMKFNNPFTYLKVCFYIRKYIKKFNHSNANKFESNTVKW